MKRIVIIGNPGVGKSTLARALHERTALPLIHVDQVYWRPGWVMREMEEAREIIGHEISKPEWIIEGNYFSTIDLRLERADTLIVLDFPTCLSFYGVMKRTLQGYGRDRPDNSKGCPERFDWAFTKWILRYNRNERPKIHSLISQAKDRGVTVYRLTDRKQVSLFLKHEFDRHA